MRELAHPSLAALGLTLASALMLQGVLSGLGSAAGAATAAFFGPARTLSRIPLQFAGLFLRPSLPELTHALTTGDLGLARRLDRMNLAITCISTLPFGLVVTIWGPQLLHWISGKNLVASHQLFFLLSLAAAINALWSALATGLIAMNRQGRFAWTTVSSAVVAVGITIIFANATAAAAAMVAAETAVLLRVFWLRRNPEATRDQE